MAAIWTVGQNSVTLLALLVQTCNRTCKKKMLKSRSEDALLLAPTGALYVMMP